MRQEFLLLAKSSGVVLIVNYKRNQANRLLQSKANFFKGAKVDGCDQLVLLSSSFIVFPLSVEMIIWFVDVAERVAGYWLER